MLLAPYLYPPGLYPAFRFLTLIRLRNSIITLLPGIMERNQVLHGQFRNGYAAALWVFLALLTVPSQGDPQGRYLYRGMTAEQDDLAQAYLSAIYSAQPSQAKTTLRKMRQLEIRASLPPMSYLLEVATHVTHLQNGDVATPAAEDTLEALVRNIADRGLSKCRIRLNKEPDNPTYLFISGGIQGFIATLHVHTDGTRALSEGYQALKQLERALQLEPRIQDGYLGTGIFHCTVASAPVFIRGAFKIFGRGVSMPTGLKALRKSAYHGRYTNVQGQLFLIRFLSPYVDELRREKRQIFRSLEKNFQGNPYFTFLKLDEALCFYPDSFFQAEVRDRIAERILTFRQEDFASRRYANLVKYQYGLLDPNPQPELKPDPRIKFRDYQFYPVFIEALKVRRRLDQAPPNAPKEEMRAEMTTLRDSCLVLLDRSLMKGTRKSIYAWHIKDALR